MSEFGIKDWKIPPSSPTCTPLNFANSCFVSSSIILILLLWYELQASSFSCEGMFSISKRTHVMITPKNIIPIIADGLFREPPCVSPSDWFGFFWTRLDESTFFWFFESIFLFSVDFLLLWDWWWINFIPGVINKLSKVLIRTSLRSWLITWTE